MSDFIMSKTTDKQLEKVDNQIEKLKEKQRELRAKKRAENQKVMVNLLKKHFNAKTPAELEKELENLDKNSSSNELEKYVEEITGVNDLSRQKRKLSYYQNIVQRVMTTLDDLNMPHSSVNEVVSSIDTLKDVYQDYSK